MEKVIRFLSLCFYHRFRVIKNCDEAIKIGLKFSHNDLLTSKKNKSKKSYWYDEFDILYKVNESYATISKKDLGFKKQNISKVSFNS